MSAPHRTPAESSDPVETLRITGPGELLQAVPYLLGFHPDNSLVVLGLHGGALVVTMRVDLPDVTDPAAAGVLTGAIDALIRGGADELVGAIYGPESAQNYTWGTVAGVLQAQAARTGARLIDVLCISAGRWRSYHCSTPGCCPPEGRSMPDASSGFCAAATYAGLVALPDRNALAAQLDPLPELQRAALEPAIAEAENAAVAAALAGRRSMHDRTITRAIFGCARRVDVANAALAVVCEPGELADFAAALTRHAVRDPLWLALDDESLDARPLWRELARQLPSPYDAAPLFLFGWRSWRDGNGALANIAAERALRSDPTYSAADLLAAALRQGVDPRTMPRVRLPRGQRRGSPRASKRR